MVVVLLSTDLAVQSRVEGAAVAQGNQLRVAGSASRALELCNSERARLIIVDLATSSTQLTELVAGLRAGDAGQVKLIAFGPHVHEEKLAAAREAGCNLVLSRGQFFSQLDKLLNS